MWPWGHLAVGYLLLSLVARWRASRPAGVAVLALVVGTQAPDLIDKPLAWTFDVLPNGRSLAHSLLVVTGVVGLTGALARHGDRRRAVAAFALGAYSHLLSDAVSPATVADPSKLAFLLWPVLPPVVYGTDKSFLAHFTSVEPTPYFLLQLVLVGVAAAVWWVDGRPGLDTVRTVAGRRPTAD